MATCNRAKLRDGKRFNFKVRSLKNNFISVDILIIQVTLKVTSTDCYLKLTRKFMK